ncbi:MAG: diguanylate cyclase [Chloroflexota bacterium]
MSERSQPASSAPAVLAVPPTGPQGSSGAGSAHGLFPPIVQFARSDPDPHRRRMPLRRYLNLAKRDPQLLLAAFMALPVVLIELIVGDTSALQALAVGGGFLVIQAILTGTPARSWSALRLLFSLAFVVVANIQTASLEAGAVTALYVPVVAMAAAIGTRGALVAAGVGVLVTIAPVVLPGFSDGARHQALAMVAAEVVLAIGSHRVVASMERAVERAQEAHALERRRTRQFNAVDSVGRLLARDGPSGDVLGAVMEILEVTFGYRYPSVYVWDGAALQLGAHRNYEHPIQTFDIGFGVIGRVARTLEPAFVRDVTIDQDYESADSAVNSEISIPLVSETTLLGVLNVESSAARGLDDDDFATMQIVGDRLSAALALGHERVKLAARATLLVRLSDLSARLNGTIEPAGMHDLVATGVAGVIDATMVALILTEPGSDDFRTERIVGGDSTLVGIRVHRGEGVAGLAIETERLVVDERLDRSRFPKAAGSADIPDIVAAMAIPLMRDGRPFGAISWLRGDVSRPYSPEEQEVAGLIGVQVSLALVNQRLLSEAREAAVTDPLTGLHNRRFFDAAMKRLVATRDRQAPDQRQPLSAVMFDLDHFGLVNKRHGHQAGDRVLRAFADVLHGRVRASDLVARYGGEEFVVLLPGATREQATLLAEEVRTRFAEKRVASPSGELLACTVSAGCAGLAPTQDLGPILIEHADVALAMAKAAGRDQVVTA